MKQTRCGAELEIAAHSDPLRGYLAQPAPGHGRGLLVLHEAWGLVDHIRDVCDRLARQGFVALAPDLYRGRSATTLDEARGLAAALEAERVGGDLEAAVAALLNHHAVDGGRVGAVGFCMGGHLALLAAARSPRVSAVVDFYGAHPGIPVDLSRMEAAVLAVFGETDEFIPPEFVEALDGELERIGGRATVRVEPGVGHAFMDDTRPDRYDAVAAAESWDRMLAFLRAELA
jgi:carboxymethylenebutenolidase